MNLDTKSAILHQIYSIYDEFANTLDVVCQRYCAACCTRNVTLTTLEAYPIAKYMISNGKPHIFQSLEAGRSEKRFHPRITTNALAVRCMEGEEPPEEENDPTWGRCPLLTGDDECPIYPMRPLGCRCFVSGEDCRKTGYADVEPFVISVNNLFLQYVEHIDADGYSGNLTDVLLLMGDDEIRQQYRDASLKGDFLGLIPNHPLKAGLIAPEHREQVMPIIQAIQRIKIPRQSS